MSRRIQVAGIRDAHEAQVCLAAGADDLAFPLGPGIRTADITETEAAKIIRTIVPPHCAVVITYLTDPEAIVELCTRVGATKVQLHAPMDGQAIRRLRQKAPRLFIIKSLIVGKERESRLIREVAATHEFVDSYLTDTFDPLTGASGATGLAHDWGISRKLASLSPVPIILAGGLKPENVFEAIVAVRPGSVDAHTGLEGPDGAKDPQRMKKFVEESRRAFQQLS
jgi:phosphoribosylanthranilate isomerase